MKNEIYLDNAATKKPYKRALNIQKKIAEKFYGNPSSLHFLGRLADGKLESCRMKISNILNCKPSDIYFTSGGTEGDNQILFSLFLRGMREGRNEIITTPMEHHAVANALSSIKNNGAIVKEVAVDKNGIVDLNNLKTLINEKTSFISVMYVNNEIGSVQPIKAIGKICNEYKIPLFTDAVQAVGQFDINVEKENIFALSASAHKFGGPRGVGFIYYKESESLQPIIVGGGQENTKRSGTQNLPGICAMTYAIKKSLKKNKSKIKELRNEFIKQVLEIPNTFLIGDKETNIYSIANICFKGIEAESMIVLMDVEGICASTGSACNSGSLEASKVLLSVGLSDKDAKSCVRFSFSENNTKKELKRIIPKIKEIVVNLRLIKAKGSKSENPY